MNKSILVIVGTALVSLFVGYMAGGICQTGRCPFTGEVILQDRAAACHKGESCNKDKAAEEAPVSAPATPAAHN